MQKKNQLKKMQMTIIKHISNDRSRNSDQSRNEMESTGSSIDSSDFIQLEPNFF